MDEKKRLCELLDERGEGYVVNDFGVTWKYYSDPHTASVAMDGTLIVTGLTSEQAIAATVGNRTDLSKRLREVSGLHAFAELFGFDWSDDSDWTWHDVACAMADAVDAATVGVTEDEADARALTDAIRDDDGVRYSMDEVMEIMGKDVAAKVGNAQEPSDAVIERIERFCTDYAHCLIDSTILDMRNYEFVDRRALEKAEVVEYKLIRELADDIAKAGAGTCHLEECEHEREVPHDLPDCDGGWYTEVTHDCDECGYENVDPNIRFCGGCGRKVVTE